MKWFKKSTVDQRLARNCSLLKDEKDVVPKTEFSASRQTLENINIALYGGESSGVPSKIKHSDGSAKQKGCANKYCCGGFAHDSQDDLTDYGDDESIKNYKNSKSTLIDNLRRADNNAHASEGSSSGAFIETDCRRSSVVIKEITNADYIICYNPSANDNGRLEVSDSSYQCVDCPGFGPYIQLKSKRERHLSQTFDLFTSSDKLKAPEHDKLSFNYQLSSNVEKKLDESRYNLYNCKMYNRTMVRARKLHGHEYSELSSIEDFNDDGKSTRMSDGTKTIKEFYKLSIESNILIHFQNISVELGREKKLYENSFWNFLTRIFLGGDEITEKRTVKESSWIKKLLNFFKAMSK